AWARRHFIVNEAVTGLHRFRSGPIFAEMTRSREGSPRGGERDDLSARGEELRNMFSRARAFTEELLRENERLRFRVAGLERELDQPGDKTPSSSSESVKELTERLRT